jgi:D-alanine-D-alanine ligase
LRETLNILFLAKHACSSGTMDAHDGNHAVYHHEIRSILQSRLAHVRAADQYEALLDPQIGDYVFTLYNRGGFRNSEVLAATLCEYRGVPYLGAPPMIRGLTDDKHFTKVVARSIGLQTPDWVLYRVGGAGVEPPLFPWERLVVKPNASSASWGVKLCADWATASDHAESLLAQGHDVVCEAYVDGRDLNVPVVGAVEPWPMMVLDYVNGPADQLRTYEEKRGLASTDGALERVDDPSIVRRITAQTLQMVETIWPFDYGRFEFRYDAHTGALWFIELNLSCNLWSKKSFGRSAELLGISHADLVESILCHSLIRQGVMARPAVPNRWAA